MRIEMLEKSTPKFYNEFLYVVNRCKKIKKNPRKRVWGLTEELAFDIVGSFLCLVLFLIYYKVSDSYLDLYCAGCMFFLDVLFIVDYIKVHKTIKAYVREDMGL